MIVTILNRSEENAVTTQVTELHLAIAELCLFQRELVVMYSTDYSHFAKFGDFNFVLISHLISLDE